MKKRTKNVSLFCTMTAVFLCATTAIQRLIFWNANTNALPQQPKKWYDWKEGAVAYEVHGTGRPLLLLHNTVVGASSIEWEKNVESLARMYQVFVVDLPGFGTSEKPKITYTAYQYALWIHHFIKDVIQRPTSIVASSGSADFALMAYALHHEDIRKLVLISPTGLQKLLATQKENLYRLVLQCPILGTHFFLAATSKKQIKKQLEKRLFFGKEYVTEKLIDSYYHAAHMGNEPARFSFASATANFMNTNIETVLQQIKIPFCVIWGEGNIENPPETMEKISELRPDGTYYLFEQTRLLPHYENSKEFNETIHGFLQ